MADFMFVPARPLRPAADWHALVATDRRPDATGFDPPAGEDAIVHAMDWLAQLRNDGDADPLRDMGYAAPLDDDGDAQPRRDDGYATAAGAALAETESPASVQPLWNPGYTPAAGTAQPAGKSPGCARTSASVEITLPAVIGNELRRPVAWCEMGACISRYSDPQALGEADIRARAIAVGWRADVLGRLACPTCQQTDPRFWTARPVALWNAKQAVAIVALMAAGRRQDHSAGRDGRAAGEMIPAVQPALRHATARGCHRERGLHASA